MGRTQVGAAASRELPEHVLEVPSLHEVPLSRGTQDLPDFARPGSAAGAPIMKERALLQARTLHSPFYLHFCLSCMWPPGVGTLAPCPGTLSMRSGHSLSELCNQGTSISCLLNSTGDWRSASSGLTCSRLAPIDH